MTVIVGLLDTGIDIALPFLLTFLLLLTDTVKLVKQIVVTPSYKRL